MIPNPGRRQYRQAPALPRSPETCSHSSAFRRRRLFGQVLLGLINGSFYAILSLGLAVIFGLLNIANFAHGALYMMGAFVAGCA